MALERLHIDQGVEYRADDAIIGRLVWLAVRSAERAPGWWLEHAHGPAELLYEAPTNALPPSLSRARHQSRPAAEGFAELILCDQASRKLLSPA